MIRRPPSSTPLSLHDALPISRDEGDGAASEARKRSPQTARVILTARLGMTKEGLEAGAATVLYKPDRKSTSELQSQSNLVCRLLLEKKKIQKNRTPRGERRPP